MQTPPGLNIAALALLGSGFTRGLAFKISGNIALLINAINFRVPILNAALRKMRNLPENMY